MTNDQKAQDRKELQLEIKARREVLKRLDASLKRLKAAAEKQKQERQTRADALSAYKTENEIMDAYGWGEITDDERGELIDALESGQRYVEDTLTPVGLALKIVQSFLWTMQKEETELKFELLPKEEQARRIEEANKWRADIEARRRPRLEETTDADL